ncbi:MAG: CorA family divalent cation transporter [Planctomycetota bacterium]|jgi:hypothetical protein
MFADGHLLLVLHAVPQDGESDRAGRLFWRDPSGDWRSLGRPDGAAALDEHLREYRKRIELLEEREHRAVTADDYFSVLSDLTPVFRSARNLQLAMQDAREQIKDARDLIDFRDRTYEIERQADLLHQDTKNGLDFTVAQRADDQAQASYRMSVASHRLNILVAFFFPIATLCAVFSTSLTFGPRLKELEAQFAPLPLLVMLLVGLAIGLILKSIITREPPDPE